MQYSRNFLKQHLGFVLDRGISKAVHRADHGRHYNHRCVRAMAMDGVGQPLSLRHRNRVAQNDNVEVAGSKILESLFDRERRDHRISDVSEYLTPRFQEQRISPNGKCDDVSHLAFNLNDLNVQGASKLNFMSGA